MFDTSKIDIQRLGLEAACKAAYEEGLGDGEAHADNRAFAAGVCAGQEMAARSFQMASTVEAVYRDKGNTVLKFADGTRSKVCYHPEYGYGYDYEKAIMAAMLKALVGNGYIKALKKFVPEGAAKPCCQNACGTLVKKQPADPYHNWDGVATPEGDSIRVAPEPPAEPAVDEAPGDFLSGLAQEPDLDDASLFLS